MKKVLQRKRWRKCSDSLCDHYKNVEQWNYWFWEAFVSSGYHPLQIAHVYILQRILFAFDSKVSCPQYGNKLRHQLGGQQTRINGGGEILTDSFQQSWMWSNFVSGPTLPQSSRKRKDRQPGRALRSHQHSTMSRESLHQGGQRIFSTPPHWAFFQDSVKNKEYTGSCSKLLVQYKAAFKQVRKGSLFKILRQSVSIPLEIFQLRCKAMSFQQLKALWQSTDLMPQQH